METIDINKALPQINQLLEKVATGEEIIITRNNQPMVKLVSTKTISKSAALFGSDKNIISIGDDFDQSLEDIIKQSDEQDKQLTPQERTEKWLDFVQNLPPESANLPEEALHRDTMYD
ncbi:type II toxin-antitoxin system Phd/YefM family antitoxin [Microcystis sp.]|jgi:prevent-host-death family protein|uniref:type II toxin-antitoxin system Phd/YefM family antitoxin n=1 Tax=Microcystis sp. TaxID=1127 RepID=UPI00391CB2C9